MIDRRSPTDKILLHDAATIESAAGGRVDLAIVLGTGLSSAIGKNFSHSAIPYDRMLGMAIVPLEGHAGEVLVGTWHTKRVLAFAGRAHLYQGFSAQQVTTNVRLSRAAGAQTVILTNAAAALEPAFEPGDLMLIADHINLTGRNPLLGTTSADPFIDTSGMYSARLRQLVQESAAAEHRLREGVYAGVVGPSYETPAEAQYLRTIGAHAVGMSTVLEAVFAYAIGLRVLGISAIATRAGTPQRHSAAVATASTAGPRLGDLVDRLIARI
ncbi:MAG: purine-nucleoside phosphorylase [Candidatus Eremiobacteraeota bacterium]|nr:purine-nucleoside phosphorylase [Candidatus Eremiobacteraeota bacterium]